MRKKVSEYRNCVTDVQRGGYLSLGVSSSVVTRVRAPLRVLKSSFRSIRPEEI